MTNNAASAPAANEPTPGANDALAGIRSRLADQLGFLGDDTVAFTFKVTDVAGLLAAYNSLTALLDAANERVAALTAELAAHKDIHHYSDEYVEALHRELSMPDATAPTRETPDEPWTEKAGRALREAKPPAPGALAAATKLNARQLLALTILAESGQGVAIWRTTSKKFKTVHRQTAKYLIGHGYAISTRNGRRIQITDEGRAALADETPDGGER